MMTTLKGITRKFRKVLKGLRLAFPKRGPFHMERNGKPVEPADVKESDTVVYGPASTVPFGWDKIEAEVNPPAMPLPETTTEPMFLPTLPLPAVFKRTERISTSDGKKRIDYRPVKNPKGGERYYYKKTVDGKARYVEVDYSKLLTDLAATA